MKWQGHHTKERVIWVPCQRKSGLDAILKKKSGSPLYQRKSGLCTILKVYISRWEHCTSDTWECLRCRVVGEREVGSGG